MLLGFSVGNFKSFKDNQTISLAAGKSARHSDHVLRKACKRILKSSLVYGVNAGGKSNLIKAIDFSTHIITSGMANTNLNKMHFMIDQDMYTKPGYFEFDILIGEREYIYGIAISYSKKLILGEWLIRKDSTDHETYIYNREYDGISHVSSIMDRELQNDAKRIIFNNLLNAFGENISNYNKKNTILADIAQRYQKMDGIIGEIQDVFAWFKDILIIYPDSECSTLTTQEKVRDDFNDMISEVVGIHSESPLMDLNDESDGTRRLFNLLPLFQLDSNPRLILIDEIDRSFHPNLTRKFIELFFERTEGYENQLIATAHDTNLMDLQLLRQDEYWFVERKNDYSSHLYSLDDFNERFDRKIDREYLIGRYGAVPSFK